MQVFELAAEGGSLSCCSQRPRLPGIDGFELGRRIVELDVPRPHMALVTSFAQRGDASTAMEAGYRCYIPKPATDLELYDAFLDLINQEPDAPSLVTRHSVAERLAEENNRSKTVLVAEDNIVNQEVTKELLSELGFEAIIAEDGVQAFDMRLEKDFGLILWTAICRIKMASRRRRLYASKKSSEKYRVFPSLPSPQPLWPATEKSN